MRELWIIGGIVGIGVAAAITFAVYLITADEDLPPDPSPTPTAISATLPAVVAPAGTTPASVPPPAAPAYEPLAWDERTRVQRLPPPTEAAAHAERPVHRNGFAFGAEPPVFEGVTGGDECSELSAGTPLRAGDWVIELKPAVAEVEIVLTPRALDFDRSEIQGIVPWMLRWTQLDGDRDRTHVHEQFWGGRDRTFEAPLLLPEAGTWRAVATYGPNWGCFFLAIESKGTIPASVGAAETFGFSYPLTDTPPERIAQFEESMVRIRGFGTPARQCVSTDGLQWARSGEFMTRVDQIAARWSTDQRGSKVAWTPLNDQDLGSLIVVGTSTDAPLSTFSYREFGPVQSSTPEGEPTGVFTFITSITPPQAGEWLLVGSAEPGNWGCFRVTVGD